MAIAEVQKTHFNGSSTGPIAVTYSSPTSGNTLVVVIVTNTSGSNTFATPSGWTAGRNEAQAAVFWKISDGTETSTDFTYTGGTTCRCWAIELSGAHASAPFDSSGYNTFTTLNSVATTTDATAAVDNEYGVSMAGMNGTNGFGESASDSYTLLSSGVEDRDVAASRTYTGNSGGSVTTTLGWTTARTGRWLIASFKPAAGAPAAPIILRTGTGRPAGSF